MSAAAVNPNYRVEHVAKTPEGWHTRTKMMATHYVVLAFPPGRRKKGSGKVIEIMHPANENPCTFSYQNEKRNPASTAYKGYLLREHLTGGMWSISKDGSYIATAQSKKDAQRMIDGLVGNPSRNPDATEQAEHLYREFHGTDPREIVEMQESDAARHTFTALGDLSQLVIHAPAGTIKIDFSHSDAVKVASAPGGRQLYLLGGNQNIDSALEQFGSDPRKDFVELGEGKQITYSARKKFDDFRLVDYYHNLGEETGERPILFYDRMKKRIFFVGGRYRVEAPGIIN